MALSSGLSFSMALTSVIAAPMFSPILSEHQNASAERLIIRNILPARFPQLAGQFSNSSCNADQQSILVSGINDAAVIAKAGVEAFDAVQASLQNPPGYAWNAILDLDKQRLTDLYSTIFGGTQDRDSFEAHTRSIENMKTRLQRISDLLPKAKESIGDANARWPPSIRMYCDDSHYQRIQSSDPTPEWCNKLERGCVALNEMDLAATLWIDSDYVPSCADHKTQAFTKTFNGTDLITFCPRSTSMSNPEPMNIYTMSLANNTKIDSFEDQPYKHILHELLHTTTFNDPDESGALSDRPVRDYVAPGSKQHILNLTAYNFDQVKTLAKQDPKVAAVNIPSIINWCIASHYRYADWSSGEGKNRF